MRETSCTVFKIQNVVNSLRIDAIRNNAHLLLEKIGCVITVLIAGLSHTGLIVVYVYNLVDAMPRRAVATSRSDFQGQVVADDGYLTVERYVGSRSCAWKHAFKPAQMAASK